MIKKFFFLISIYFALILETQANPNFFEEGKKYFKQKDYEKSKFMFHKEIVFNPQNSYSYLYLSKIFKIEGDNLQQEQNLKTSLLLNPKNEEAVYLLINLKLEQSDFNEVDELTKQLVMVCEKYCSKESEIKKKLDDLTPKTNN